MPTKYLKQVKTMIPSDLVSVPEASKITGIRQRTVWKQIREGRLRAWGRAGVTAFPSRSCCRR